MNFKRVVIFICIVYTVAGGIFTYLTNMDKVNNLIGFYKTYQNEMLDYIKERFENTPDENAEDPEYIDDIFDLRYTYGFVYSDNMVIFEKDMETTRKYGNSTVRELFNDYAQESGNRNAPNIMKILFHDSGTAYIKKNNDTGREIISWRNIRKNDKDYVVGIAVPVSTVLEVSEYKKYMILDVASYLLNSIIIWGGAYAAIRKASAK